MRRPTDYTPITAFLLFLMGTLLLPGPLGAQNTDLTRRLNLNAVRQSLTGAQREQLFRVRDGVVDTVAPASGELNLSAGEYLFMPKETSPKTTTMPEVQLGMSDLKKSYYLPETYYVPVASGEEVRTVQPLLLQESLLRYSPEKKAFSGSFLILLEDLQNNTSNEQLSTSLEIQFVSEEAAMEPVLVSLNSTNWPPKSVEIAAPNPTDSVEIRAVTPANVQGVRTWLKVEPSLVIETSSQHIQGWGVQAVPLFISVRGGSFDDSVAVSLEAVPGSVSPDEIYVKSNRTARTWLRSEGLGEATVTAFSPRFENTSTTFDYTFPLMFLGFSLFGGVVGGVISFLRARKKEGDVHFWLHLAGGTTWGLVVAVGYVVLGINLLQIDINADFINEFMVFGISALGGISWSAASLLKKPG